MEAHTSEGDLSGEESGGAAAEPRMALRLPSPRSRSRVMAATPRKVYANAHTYHINSVSMNSDGETFVSADDLRINLWNLEVSDVAFSQ